MLIIPVMTMKTNWHLVFLGIEFPGQFQSLTRANE